MDGTSTTLERAHVERLLSLEDIDGRFAPVRKVFRLARALERDLGDDLSTAQMLLVRRAAVLGALCEHSEASFLSGREALPIADYLQAANTLKRMLAELGLRRVPKDITPPSVAEYLAHVVKQKEGAAS
jgi:hypothetical protein